MDPKMHTILAVLKRGGGEEELSRQTSTGESGRSKLVGTPVREWDKGGG